MKKILVPIDFSACSENALLFAMQLADKINATIHVLNITSIDGNLTANPLIASRAIEEQFWQSKKLLNKTIQRVMEKIPISTKQNPEIQANIEMGVTDTKICEIASSLQVDFIVMGTHGTRHALDKYLGGTTAKVLKNAPCPVLVVPKVAEFKEQMVLGYATDLLNAAPFEIWKSRKLLKLFQPEIKCVHINETSNANLDKMKEFSNYFAEVAPNINLLYYSIDTSDKSKVKNMNNFINDENIDMLSMYKPQRSFFEAIFHNSFTERMAKYINIPLLVIK